MSGDTPLGCVQCSWLGRQVYKYCSACQKLFDAAQCECHKTLVGGSRVRILDHKRTCINFKREASTVIAQLVKAVEDLAPEDSFVEYWEIVRKGQALAEVFDL